MGHDAQALANKAWHFYEVPHHRQRGEVAAMAATSLPTQRFDASSERRHRAAGL